MLGPSLLWIQKRKTFLVKEVPYPGARKDVLRLVRTLISQGVLAVAPKRRSPENP